MADYTEGFIVSVDDILKKINEGKINEIKPEDIAAITKSSSGLDVWPLILLTLLPGVLVGNSSADYWRGKCDAYKELITLKGNADG